MNTTGKIGEDIARNYLVSKGYIFLESDYATRYGEIDLIMKQKEQLIFVEVKTRKKFNQIAPNNSLPPYKLTRLQNAIDLYLQDQDEVDWRVELVAVTLMLNGYAKICIIEL